VAVVVAGVLAATARVAPVTLAVGAGAGIVLGAVMYAVFPLGLARHATNPWLHGFPVGMVVLLAWILLLGGPVLAGVIAAWSCRGPRGPQQATKAEQEQNFKVSVRQAGMAGFLTTAVGALMVAVLGTVTVALMPRAGWVLHWLYPGQHLSAAVAYSRELTASVRAKYGLILLAFPVIGLILGWASGASAASEPHVCEVPSTSSGLSR
jgi:hypothetical protein